MTDIDPHSPIWEMIPGARDRKCHVCGVAVEIGKWCESCLLADNLKLDRARIARSLSALKRSAPKWPWPVPAESFFAERVRFGRFRGFAEKWKPEVGNVVLSGPSGTGKTSAMFFCMSRLGDEAIESVSDRHPICRAVWTSALRLARAAKEHRLGNGPVEAVRDATHASILFLDEVGQEPRSELLFDLLNERYEGADLVTVVTTGLDLAQLRNHIGDAAVRRLVERGTHVEAPGA